MTDEHLEDKKSGESDALSQRLVVKTASESEFLSDLFSITTIDESDVATDARVVICPPPPGHAPKGHALNDSLEAVVLPKAAGQSVIVAHQSSETTGFKLDLGMSRRCHFYYDVSSDNLIAYNKGSEMLHLVAIETDEGKFGKCTSLPAWETHLISPGYWRIESDKDGKPDQLLTELLLFRRRFSFKRSSHIAAAAGSKKPVSKDEDDTSVAVRETSTSLQFISRFNPMLQVLQSMELSVISPDPEDNFTVANLRDIDNRDATLIFRGEHSRFGDSVVKVIKKRNYSPETLDAVRLAKRWNREVHFMASIEHDNIVKFYGADGRFYSIFMEYLPYPDLSTMHGTDYTFTGTTQVAVRILRDCSSALAYLAERNIMHNDIKPGNILYDENRGAVLIDFGLASFDGGSQLTGGTFHYMPPELLEERRVLVSDVWSLGVTMLYLVGVIPLPGWLERNWKLGISICHSAASWYAHIEHMRKTLGSDGVEAIVARMLPALPGDRSSAAAIKEMVASLTLEQPDLKDKKS